MEEIRPRLRAVRAALFAALCVTLSSTSHVLLARSPLPLTAVAGAFAGVFALAYLLGGRERGFWSIAALMVPLELALDTLFTAGRESCYGPSGGPVTGSWRSFHEVVLCHGGQVGAQVGGGLATVPGGQAAQHVPSVALPWLLLAAHMTVGLLAAWWLGRGEAAAQRVLRAMGAAAFPLLLAFAAVRGGLGAPPRRVGAAATRGVAGARPARPLLHAVVRRGPPVPVAL